MIDPDRQSKRCPVCRQERDIVAFARDCSKRDGRRGVCRACEAAQKRVCRIQQRKAEAEARALAAEEERKAARDHGDTPLLRAWFKKLVARDQALKAARAEKASVLPGPGAPPDLKTDNTMSMAAPMTNSRLGEEVQL
jgi:hypothetical protein